MKHAFRKGFALLLAALLLLGVLPVTASAQAVTLLSDGDGYYLNMTETGQDTLDLSNKESGFSFKLYDVGGAGADYTARCDSTLTITAPAGCVFSVTGSGVIEHGWDVLDFIDSDGSTQLGSYSSGQDAFTIYALATSDNVLSVHFSSDSSGNRAGFELIVTIVDPASIVTFTFEYGDNVQNQIAVIGETFTIPDFASMFTLNEGLQFTGWQSGANTYIPGDTIETAADMTFTALVGPEPLLAQDFSGNWYAKIRNDNLEISLADRSNGFTMTVYDSGGPEGAYSNNYDGSLTITAPEGFILKVYGSGTIESKYDKLYIYDGNVATETALYTGEFSMPEIITSGSVLKIRFTSDSSRAFSGFALNVTIIDPATMVPFTFESAFGTAEIKVTVGSTYVIPDYQDLFGLPEGATFDGWEHGGRTYAAGESYSVEGAANFTALLNVPQALFADGDEWYVNMTANALIAVDLGDKEAGFSFKVYDDGGSEREYSNSQSSAVIIAAPAGCVLGVEAICQTESSSWDYLSFFEGDGITPIGSEKYGGALSVSGLISTGGLLRIRFIADSSTNNSGFALTVTVIDASTVKTISFNAGEGSGTMPPVSFVEGASYTLPQCSFTPPANHMFMYYTDGERTYSPGSTITVTKDMTLTALYAQQATVVYENGTLRYVNRYVLGSTLELTTYRAIFELPYRKDFLYWSVNGEIYYPGDSYTLDQDVTFTAVFEDLPLLIEDDERGLFAYLPMNEEVYLDLSDKSIGFNFLLYDNGIFGNYSNNSDAVFTIAAPEGCVLLIEGSYNVVNGDSLLVYNGTKDSENYNEYGGGSGTIERVITSGATGAIRFRSNASGTAEGFTLKISVIGPDTLCTVGFDPGEGSGEMTDILVNADVSFVVPQCSFTPPEGKVFSYYDMNGTAVLPGQTVSVTGDATLTAIYAEAVELIFTDGARTVTKLAPKNGEYKLPEYEELFPKIGQVSFRGWGSGETLYPAGTVVTITESTTFTAVITFQPVLISDGENGWYVNMPLNDTIAVDLTQETTGFEFKVYDDGGKNGQYQTGNYSYLNILAPQGTHLMVTGGGSTESANWDPLCFYDGIYDGSSNFPRLGSASYGGTDFSVGTIVSSGNMMTIFFTSDSTVVKDGFELTVKVIDAVSLTFRSEAGNEKTQPTEKYANFKLPAYGDLFELQENYEFVYWEDANGARYAEGEEIFPESDMIFTATTQPMPLIVLDGGGAALKDGSGSGSVEARVKTGTTGILPHASEFFVIPEGTVFGGWAIDDGVYAPGDAYTVAGDTTATALWREPSAWDLLVETLAEGEGADLGTITLEEDLIAGIGSLPLTLPRDTTVRIDLAGFTIDGIGAAHGLNGVYLISRGDLTVVDSVGGGRMTGGGIQIMNGSDTDLPADILAQFGVVYHQNYLLRPDDEAVWTTYNYADVYMPTLTEAFAAASNTSAYRDFRNDIDNIPASGYYFSYSDPRIMLLKDLVIEEGETVEANIPYDVHLDLNGFTFENRGTFTGRYLSQYDLPAVELPAYILIESTVPGVFRSSGTIDLEMQTETGDTYYFTGGEYPASFTAYGGTFHISGGAFTELTLENNSSWDAPLNVELTGDVVIGTLQYDLYVRSYSPAVQVTISGNAAIGNAVTDITATIAISSPALFINGGYFHTNPTEWAFADGCTAYAAEPESFSDQADWLLDPDVYGWRVTAPAGPRYDLNNDGDVTVADVSALLDYIAGVSSEDLSTVADFTGDGDVTVADVSALLDYIANL